MGLSYQEFKEVAAQLTGVDLSAYKSQQMDRRIHSLMNLWGVADYDEYLAALRTNEARFKEFQKKLTINVSEFYRNPDRFTELVKMVLPELCRSGRRLRIWSAGCSNGAEPYTLAIMIKESGYPPGARIQGTDLDCESLHRAQDGIYGQNEVRNVPPDILARYFTTVNSGFALTEEIKRMVEFRHHNLLHDHYERDYDLILCRNVVIYFTESTKEGLYIRLCQSLRPGGYLMVGGTEPLLNFREHGLENPLTAFYRKMMPSGPLAGREGILWQSNKG